VNNNCSSKEKFAKSSRYSFLLINFVPTNQDNRQNMGFWKQLFGGQELTPEEEQQNRQDKNFDLLKYDGVKALKIGKADYAVRCFTEALKLKADLEINDYLSQAYIRLGELDKAMQQLDILDAAHPDQVQILIRMAQVAFMMEDYERMDLVCSRARQADNHSADACYLGAQARLGRQQTDSALELLSRAIALRDDYADAYLLRGRTLLAIGHIDDADADAAWLLNHVGAQEDALMLKARVEVARANLEQAVTIYGLVLEVNPFCAEAFRERANLRRQQGDEAGAEADLQSLRELDPTQDVEDIEQQVKAAYSNVNPLGL
jgi:tetratricopeptide (TPR) repeat protein